MSKRAIVVVLLAIVHCGSFDEASSLYTDSSSESTSTSSSTSTAPSTSTSPLTKKYYVITEQRTFVGSIIACKTAGMELASIESSDEQYAAIKAISEAEYSSSNGYWIGGADETISSSDWYWLSTGYKMVYTNWGTLQPRYTTYDASVGSCVRMGNFYKVNEPYTWENIKCDNELYGICQTSS